MSKAAQIEVVQEACRTKLFHMLIIYISVHSTIPTGGENVRFPTTNQFLVTAAGPTHRTAQHFCTSL